MKQFQFEYQDLESFSRELSGFKDRCGREHIAVKMIQVFAEELDREKIQSVCSVITQRFPEALCMGCSTNGNIIDCGLSAKITIVCTAFERSTTQVRLFQYDLSENSARQITSSILAETQRHPWVKAIEMFFTIPQESSTQFCEGLKELRPEIQVFGGVASSDDITSTDSLVFSGENGISEHSILIVFYGGEDFYADAISVTGWKPLGRKFQVTKSHGSILQELDGIPAYDIYRKYLNIENDENFLYNTLEFPLFYEHNDTIILRTPVASNADGSITMTSDIEIGSVVRISYGDPGTIIESIRHDSRRIADFQPDLLHIFSCAARRTFWTSREPTYEIYPFQSISPSCGFFSHGEFLRTNGNLNQHNVTLVIAAMREGKKRESAPAAAIEESHLAKVPLVSRLATFISATSMELEESNRKLESVNEKLKMAAIIDGLTGLYNRKEIQARIDQALLQINEERFSLIMLDIDNFKQVNDTYGHQQGDNVIKGLANILHYKQADGMHNISAGRWGGEEFMMLLPGSGASSAVRLAELIRKRFANTEFSGIKPQTVSLGVTQAEREDTSDSLCSRVDMALYRAKKSGKNKVVLI
ncbi:MAG: diguanylate cyclase [Lachnospiraceae bacterium]|nr:diguanylate cyclase [Lachnospiraceae bacterium]